MWQFIASQNGCLKAQSPGTSDVVYDSSANSPLRFVLSPILQNGECIAVYAHMFSTAST